MTSAENSISEPLTWPQTPYKTCAYSTRDNAPLPIKKSLATALEKAYVKQSQYVIGAASSCVETCLFFS